MKMDILHESCWGEIKTRKGRNVFLSSEMKMTIFEFQFSSSPAEKTTFNFFPHFWQNQKLEIKASKSSETFQLNVLLPLSSFVTKSTKYQNIIERNLFVHQKSSPPLLNLTWKALTLKLFNENFFWIKKHFLRKTKKWQSAIQLICLACLFRRGVEPRKGLTRVLKQHD